ncbi:defender against death DAD protein [Microstroma glucosiphilum]|uniref:Dolichyl-diphosphooligosaccharide--protein glycosyltransferase subunit OST2 n=1 Tax=Pseudomicrostroma glucosiphilum TaxID=1684307 RepID=A0A316U2K0_9BASI|nr:defender against death DAD protein [Pseudomicrostroma glucosiphilum]PWN18711.1 defender against death DAD protein [Pseudomicrostroma glucosiphilum]
MSARKPPAARTQSGQASSSSSSSSPAISGKVSSAASSNNNPIPALYKAYSESTPPRHKLIDAFLVFYIVAGVIIFAHGLLVTTFPFNSWIAAFISTAGQFVLLASLRIQTTPTNQGDFPKISPERAFVDFLFASVILHFFVVNYLQ